MFIYVEIVKTERYQGEKMKLRNSIIIMIKILPGITRRSPIQVLTGLDVA